MFVRVVGDRESEWSNKFSLDALGNEGVVSCKLKDSSVELMVRYDQLVVCVISPAHLVRWDPKCSCPISLSPKLCP